jgi:hypothetical protein
VEVSADAEVPATTMRDQDDSSPHKEATMPNYNQTHQFYAGVDLHARCMFVLPAELNAFLDAVKPFRKNLVVGCECMFAWYWLADLCADKRIPFVLGHALAMKHILGGKAKSDADKLAHMLRGGMFPLAYLYPRAKRQTRDLLRRRCFFVRQRAQRITHIMNTNSQFNLPPFSKKLSYAARSVTLFRANRRSCGSGLSR